MKNEMLIGALCGIITLLLLTVLISLNRMVKGIEPMGWVVFATIGASVVYIRRLIQKVWP